jgi:hypothetical protein
MINSEYLRGLLKSLLASQRFAVLATQLSGQPYNNLVVFAVTDDLNNLLFVTSRRTQKYANIMANKKAAMLIDNRTNQVSDLNVAVAVTALGIVKEVAANKESPFLGVYTLKHPNLVEFINRPVNALMKLSVTDYIVASFDKVQVFHMDNQDIDI